MLTQRLDVGDELVGGVGAQIDSRIASVRSAASASALIEQDDAGAVGVERAPDPGDTP
jgi:hypothetical protein